MAIIELSLMRNKRNNQLSIVLPRNELKFLKGKNPKKVRVNIREVDFKW